MNSCLAFIRSSVGKKYIMGLSGLVWVGFIFGHMLGNLLIFVGPEMYNRYAHAIVSNKPLLYGTEFVLVLSIVAHVFMAIWITKENKEARPEAYAVQTNGKKAITLASRTMIYTGTIVLVFLVLHLLSFKYGTFYSINYDGVEMRDMYRNMAEAFTQPLYVIWYLLSLVLLGFHLKHGFQAAFQSLGLSHPRYVQTLKCLALLYAIVVVGGFISQPLYIFVRGG